MNKKSSLLAGKKIAILRRRWFRRSRTAPAARRLASGRRGNADRFPCRAQGGARPPAHLVSLGANRPEECRRKMDEPENRRRPQPSHEPQAGRHPVVQPRDRPRVRGKIKSEQTRRAAARLAESNTAGLQVATPAKFFRGFFRHENFSQLALCKTRPDSARVIPEICRIRSRHFPRGNFPDAR